jgi:hypothetical protein
LTAKLGESDAEKLSTAIVASRYCIKESKVQFDPETIEIFTIKVRWEFTEEDFHGIWYGQDDLSRISSSSRMAIKLMSQLGDLSDEPDHCIRELEHKVKDEMTNRRKDQKIIPFMLS